MLESPESLASREQDFLELLKPWVSELMTLHGVSEADRKNLIAHVASLPVQEDVREMLTSDKSRERKLGYLAGMFVVWKEIGKLPPEFSSFADRIREHAIQGGFHS